MQVLLWGNARHNPAAARNAWAKIFAASLSFPLSRDARKRLQWFFSYNTTFKGNARKTCRYYGIPPKTFYFWRNRFDPTEPRSLEERSHRPRYGPLPVLNPEQTRRLYDLRWACPFYSKMKIAAIYEQRYGVKISAWQVQRIIERFQLYPDVKRARRIAWKRQHAVKKLRITKLAKEAKTGFLVCLDTIVVRHENRKLYIFTALDRHSRWGIARCYKSPSSKNAADFLRLVQRQMRGTLQNIQTDNGSEFHLHFQRAVRELKIGHYWSRVKTPKDNPNLERFNRTLQEECLPPWKGCTDIDTLNGVLIEWLDDYNHERPHMALGYKTPYEVAFAREKCYSSPLH